MIDERCICVRYCPGELIAAWNARARATLARMLGRGIVVDHQRIFEVRTLQKGLTEGKEYAFDPKHLGKSHHLPECPCKAGRTVVCAG